MSRRVLFIAFHFPPMGGSSGVLRSLKFVKYLPANGWNPTVLSANPRAYTQLDESGLDEIPQGIEIIRAFGLDARKHLSFRSRYPRFLANPDRWSSWYLDGVFAGWRAIHRLQIDLIFSTYPIATAHLIGKTLHQLTGKDWIADFRDPMVEEEYPNDPLARRRYQDIERQVVTHASRLIYTTESTKADLDQRYPDIHPEKSIVISNGYDESDFIHLAHSVRSNKNGPIRLVHGGLIYTNERDPRPLFRAIRRLLDEGRLTTSTLRIEFRGSGCEKELRALIDASKVGEIVTLSSPLPYRAFLEDAAQADGLLLMQGSDCDRQIPAKAYEYLRLGKPILALTTSGSETSRLFREAGGATIATLDSEPDIREQLITFVSALKGNRHESPRKDVVNRYSRSWQAGQLAACFDNQMAK